MEKISRILAPSARTKSYDVARAQPVRPGAPQMGRPQSMDVIQDRMTISEKFLDPIMNGETIPSAKPTLAETYKPREAANVKSQVVKEMTNQFFIKQNAKDVARETDQTKSEEVVSLVQSSAPSSVNPDSSKETSL